MTPIDGLDLLITLGGFSAAALLSTFGDLSMAGGSLLKDVEASLSLFCRNEGGARLPTADYFVGLG